MKLIINADDFGYSRGINFGILDAYQFGVVRSCSIMANMPAFDHAVQLAGDNPGLGSGPLKPDLWETLDRMRGS